MASRADLGLPVEARGSLRLDTPTGRAIQFRADGDTLTLSVPGIQELKALAGRPAWSRRRALRATAAALKSLRLGCVVDLAGQPILRMGAGIRPTWLARLTGLGPASVPLSAVVTLWRNRN